MAPFMFSKPRALLPALLCLSLSLAPGVHAQESTPEGTPAPEVPPPATAEIPEAQPMPPEPAPTGEPAPEAQAEPEVKPEVQAEVSPEVQPEAPPAPAESQADAQANASPSSEMPSTSGRRMDVPRYHYERPTWAAEVLYSRKSWGGTAKLGNASADTVRAFDFSLHYQPAFLQDFGILGFGPKLSVYPILPRALTSSFFSLLSVGAQVQYQARYFREQPVVPIVGYSAEAISYRLESGQRGSLSASGPVFGAYIYLNIFDPSGAGEFYGNHGVLRSYLVIEYRNLQGTSADVSFSGRSVYAGLRLEF